MLFTTIAFLLFGLECFNALAHFLILFRIRLLPRKDMLRIRYYFLLDILSVQVSSYFVTGESHLLTAIHFLLHTYHYMNWESAPWTKKIVTWTSLDLLQSDFNRNWQIDAIVQVVLDLAAHLDLAYHLGTHLTIAQMIAAIVIVLALLRVLLFGPYYAWANPNNIPAWIQKRIHPDKVEG